MPDGASTDAIGIFGHERLRVPGISGRSAENPAEPLQGWSYPDAVTAELELPNRMLMVAAALLDHGQSATDAAIELKVTEHDHRIGEVTNIERGSHWSDQTVLGENQDRQDAELAEKAEQLVHLKDEETLVRHSVEIAVQAVNNDDSGTIVLDGASDQVGEFPGRQLCGINLLDPDEAGLRRFIQGQTQGAGASVHSASPFIEGEYDRTLPSRGRSNGVGKGQGRFADAGGSDKERVGATFKAPTQQRIKLGVAAGNHVADKVLMMFGRD
jgi:hypothetical protein